jgi:hypothetical protein
MNDNTVNNLFDSILADGTSIYKFTRGHYESANSCSVLFGCDYANQLLLPGEGVLAYMPPSTPITVTFAGEIRQGTTVNALPSGLSLISSLVPQPGKLVTELGFPACDGDQVYQLNNPEGYAISITPGINGIRPSPRYEWAKVFGCARGKSQ